MQYKSILALATVIGAAVAFPAPAAPEGHELFRRQYPTLQCSHITGGLHVIAAGGANSDDPKEIGLLGTLANNITAAIPGSTRVSLPYNKQFQPGTSTLMPGAISDGMHTLKQYVINYHYSCPKTKIALIGYSSGAIIQMNDMCLGGNGVNSDQLNPLIEGNIIIGSVSYGDETRTANQPYNVGTCSNSLNGIAPRSNPGLCSPFSKHMQSYCDTADPDCCVGSGNDVSVHLSYPSKYDYVATQFIVNRFNAEGGA